MGRPLFFYILVLYVCSLRVRPLVIENVVGRETTGGHTLQTCSALLEDRPLYNCYIIQSKLHFDKKGAVQP